MTWPCASSDPFKGLATHLEGVFGTPAGKLNWHNSTSWNFGGCFMFCCLLESPFEIMITEHEHYLPKSHGLFINFLTIVHYIELTLLILWLWDIQLIRVLLGLRIIYYIRFLNQQIFTHCKMYIWDKIYFVFFFFSPKDIVVYNKLAAFGTCLQSYSNDNL